jgi:hypothetical protein
MGGSPGSPGQSQRRVAPAPLASQAQPGSFFPRHPHADRPHSGVQPQAGPPGAVTSQNSPLGQ